MATAVVLNGASSSGKTSIARAFQELAPRTFLNFSIDSILLALPPSGLARIASGADISDLEYPRLARAFHACVRQLLELGHDVVIDNAITAQYQAELLVAALSGHEVLMVGVDCPVDVLTQREQRRGDRRAGLAAQQCERIHRWLLYDLMVDTSTVSAQDAAAKIVESLLAGKTGAFQRTRQEFGR